MCAFQVGSDALQHVTTLHLDPGTVILGRKPGSSHGNSLQKYLVIGKIASEFHNNPEILCIQGLWLQCGKLEADCGQYLRLYLVGGKHVFL